MESTMSHTTQKKSSARSSLCATLTGANARRTVGEGRHRDEREARDVRSRRLSCRLVPLAELRSGLTRLRRSSGTTRSQRSSIQARVNEHHSGRRA
jgi:hypothetical protein